MIAYIGVKESDDSWKIDSVNTYYVFDNGDIKPATIELDVHY